MRLTLLDRLALPRGLKAVANAVILSLIVSAPLIGGSGDKNANSYNSDDRRVPQIAAGIFHVLAIKDGKVYATGSNDHGQLGLGDFGEGTNRDTFTEIASLSDKNITAIFAGEFHSFALSKDGKVYGAGYNAACQLGLGDGCGETYLQIFTEIKSLNDKNITAIAAGEIHSLALSKDGKVYAAGSNYHGQLGLGGDDWRDTFTEVKSLSDKNIVAIAAGAKHSLALTENGEVYAAGLNEASQLGLGGARKRTNRNTFTKAASLTGKTIKAIAAAGNYSLALTKDGEVYATGEYDGEVVLGDWSAAGGFVKLNAKNIVAIAAGDAHCLALDKNGKVYAMGYSANGQIGTVENEQGTESFFSEVQDLSDKRIIAIYVGSWQSFVVDQYDDIYATGWNKYGQLGLGGSGEETDRHTFTLVPIK
jgi:alpha-tubulin suppressor-like RCC1 family protein